MDKVNYLMRAIMTRKYFPLFITLCLMACSSLAVWGLLSNNSMIIERPGLVMRRNAATNQEKVADLVEGDTINIIGQKNGWLHVRKEDLSEGWIPQWLLENNKLNNDQEIAIKTLMSSDLLAEATDRSNHLIEVPLGTYLLINYESNGWVQVTYEGKVGYLKADVGEIINESDMPQETYERLESQEQENTDGPSVTVGATVKVKSFDSPLYAEPSTSAETIYTVPVETTLVYLETVTNDAGQEFYFVQDGEGRQGYLDTTYVSKSDYSTDHLNSPKVSSLKEAKVLIDPGHGGEDPGATAYDNGSYEKEHTLATALKVKEKLEAAGATVTLTRESDQWVELSDRAKLANDQDVDVFLSLHYDSSPGAGLHGVTTYYYHDADQTMANSVNNQLATLEINNNGVHFGNYQVLRENHQPALLLELGYVSEKTDLKFIRSDAYHEQVANAIVNGLNAYFENN